MTGTPPLLEFRSVCFAYEGKEIVSDMSFSVPSGGQVIGMIGPNGVGKTTLLRLMMGLELPGDGQILIGGKGVEQFERKALARNITLVPQDTHVDYPFSVEDMVSMGRHPHKRRFETLNREDIRIIQQAMDATQTAHLRDQAVNTLSGGERQRVLVARAIVQQTPIVLLDEVTANLDLCHQLEIMGLARSLAENGKLVIATVHDLSLASRYCDQLLLLGEHAVQANAAPESVLTPDNLNRFFAIEAKVDPSVHLKHGLVVTPIRPSGDLSRVSQPISTEGDPHAQS